jgi:DNA-binding CsgD family transcriptional regulator
MIMRYVERKSYDEIADIECVDPETIRKSILRSKKKLNII